MRVPLIEDDTVLDSALQHQIVADCHPLERVTRLDGADEALALAHFDLLLLDLMLPDGRGNLPEELEEQGQSNARHHPYRTRSGIDPNRGVNAGADNRNVTIELSAEGRWSAANMAESIPQDKPAVLTSRFERGATTAQGNGLGLAIVSVIAEGADGTLTLNSPPSIFQ